VVRKFYATVEQHACKGGAGMLGLIEIPENIKSGEFYHKLGRFSSVEHAGETMQAVPIVDFKTYATAYAPLGETPFEPDVVVLVVNPRQAMMIAQANVYELIHEIPPISPAFNRCVAMQLLRL